MTKIREVISAHAGPIAGLLGVLGLLLLDLPFLVMTSETYGWVSLASGYQAVIQGLNLNPAEIVWESYPSQVYSSLPIPGVGLGSIPLIFLVSMIITGALVTEIGGFTTVFLSDKEPLESAGKLIGTGGGLIAFSSLILFSGIIVFITSTNYLIIPGLAILGELTIGLVITGLGLRIRRHSNQE